MMAQRVCFTVLADEVHRAASELGARRSSAVSRATGPSECDFDAVNQKLFMQASIARSGQMMDARIRASTEAADEHGREGAGWR